MLDVLRGTNEKLVIGGDGRHDSMGHSAKYGAYTTMCCNKPQLIHFELVQVNFKHNLVFPDAIDLMHHSAILVQGQFIQAYI